MLLFLKVMMAEFIAEMGDKTQLMLIAMTSKYKLLHIIIGTAAAILVLNGIAVLAGGLVGSFIPEWLIKIIAALAFLVFAGMSIRPDDEEDGEGERGSRFRLAPVAVFFTFVVAEMGDKTQLTAVTFGANEGIDAALAVWLACSLGLFAADIIGLLVGYLLKSRIPERAMNLLAYFIFAVFGIVTLRQGLVMMMGSGSRVILPALVIVSAVFALISIVILITSRRASEDQGQ